MGRKCQTCGNQADKAYRLPYGEIIFLCSDCAKIEGLEDEE